MLSGFTHSVRRFIGLCSMVVVCSRAASVMLLLPMYCLLLPVLAELSVDPNTIEATTAERYLVLQITRLGLANRLRTLADMHQIAMLSNRILLLSWKPTYECNASFFDLFESAPEGLQVLPMVLEDGPLGIQAVKSMAAENGLTYRHLDREKMEKEMGLEDDFFWPRSVFDGEIDVLHTSYDGVLVMSGIRCQDHMTMRSSFLRGLVPVPEIRNLLRDITQKYYKNRIPIGIHIRGYDTAYDWEVVPPSGDSPLARKFGEGATVGDFESAMRSILNHFGPDRVRFFIASNMPEAKSYLQGKFKDSIAIFGDESRSSRDGMQFALLEFLLLSESALLLHTYGSSFAMEAAQVHLRPLVGIFSGVLIRHVDINIYQCGNQQFIKALSKQGGDCSYTEGTINREIKCKKIELTPCSEHLASWGLPLVSCNHGNDLADGG